MFFLVCQAWLCDVERSMRWTLKELLKQCRLALKKNTSKRDKWVKEWAGQVSDEFLVDQCSSCIFKKDAFSCTALARSLTELKLG